MIFFQVLYFFIFYRAKVSGRLKMPTLDNIFVKEPARTNCYLHHFALATWLSTLRSMLNHYRKLGIVVEIIKFLITNYHMKPKLLKKFIVISSNT